MITKINVPKTSIVIEIENKEIKIENMRRLSRYSIAAKIKKPRHSLSQLQSQ